MPRENKGYSLLALRKDYTALDLETTGLDPRMDGIIEIGAIRVRDGHEVERYHTMVNPERPIPWIVTDITGITDDMVKDAPKLDETLGEFLNWLGDDVLLGHNVNFDINFLYDHAEELHERPVSNDFIDTMRLARHLYPNEKHNRLTDLIARFDIAETQEHRALADVEQTIACYDYMIGHLDDLGVDLPADEGRRRGWSGTLFRGEDDLLQIAPVDEVTPDPAFEGLTFVFTGALKRMTRENAQRAVANLGGLNGKNVTKSTNYLVTGSTDYNSALKGEKSSKWKKAEKLQSEGQDISIISEDVFYDMLGDSIAEAPTMHDLKFSIGSTAWREIPDGPVGEKLSYEVTVEEITTKPGSSARPALKMVSEGGETIAEFTAQMKVYAIIKSLAGKKMHIDLTRCPRMIGDRPYFHAKASNIRLGDGASS